MGKREQVLELLDEGHSYETAARELGIGPGLAFMLATGMPADGSGVPSPEQLEGKPVLPGSSQHLVNPPALNPTRHEGAMRWVRERARRELKQPA